MDAHHVARVLAIGRAVIGASLLLGPGRAARVLGIERPTRTVTMLVRAAGGRDLVLGLGAFTALAEGRDASRWVRMGAVADGIDAVALAAARRDVDGATALAGCMMATTAAVAGARAAAELAD